MSNKPTFVVEEYLLLLYKLRDSHGHIKAVDLAQRLNIRPPTVHATLQRMQRDGMVQIGDTVSYTHLTLPTTPYV